MKPQPPPTRHPRSFKRIHAVRLYLLAFVLCNLLVGWLIWQQRISGELAWAIQFLCGAALMFALFVLNRRALAAPIGSIAAWASRIRQGDFSARLEDQRGLHALTDDINRLAEWLESLAESKNRELLEQGARLKTQTHIVRLLYDISGDYSHNATADELLERTLRPMAAVLDAQRIEFYRIAGAQQPTAAWGASDSAAGECVRISLRLSQQAAGECCIWFAAGRFPLPDEFSQLLYTLGRNIGMALERIDLHAESARLSRMHERTHLANELHDSLAQTIAGLRFQVQILDDLLQQQAPADPDARQQLHNVETLLAEANAELRSLIGYFRAPIDPGGLRPAIKAAVARFRADSKIPLFFQERWGEVDIPEKWQLEIVRIIQEALSNIRQHSRAKNARVLLRCDARRDPQKYTVLVEDDGVGMADAGNSDHAGTVGEHIGLSVMAQRARSIGAEFHIDSERGEGTRILLCFRRVTPHQQQPSADARIPD